MANSFLQPEEGCATQQHNLDIEAGLRHGLLEGQFRLHFQR